MAALPEPEIRVPDVFGEILGWRAWELVGGDLHPRLRSVTAHELGVPLECCIWPTNRWFLAMCPHGCGDVPREGCRCGIYAAAERGHLISYGYAKYDCLTDKVIGVVGLTGKVIPGSQGWRAEKGRIVRLEVPFEKWQLGERLSKAYGVPVGLGNLWARGER